MSEAKGFHLSRGGSCKLPSCNHQRVELQVVDWTGCGGEAREESFDVTTWTPQQFAALRVFINCCGALALAPLCVCFGTAASSKKGGFNGVGTLIESALNDLHC